MGLFNIFGGKKITPVERRSKSLERLRKEGVKINENLPLLPSSEEVKFKSNDEIMNRIIAAFTAIQVACSIRNGEDYDEAVQYMIEFMKKCKGDQRYLLDKERRILENNYSKQDVIDVIWTYEGVFTLMWAINYKADKYEYDVSQICSGDAVIFDMRSIAEGTNCVPHLREEKVLNMLDLFYCYHWACVEKQIHPETPIGNVNFEVVVERRRALEWLISDENDWFNIDLNT